MSAGFLINTKIKADTKLTVVIGVRFVIESVQRHPGVISAGDRRRIRPMDKISIYFFLFL